ATGHQGQANSGDEHGDIFPEQPSSERAQRSSASRLVRKRLHSITPPSRGGKTRRSGLSTWVTIPCWRAPIGEKSHAACFFVSGRARQSAADRFAWRSPILLLWVILVAVRHDSIAAA